MPETPLRVLYVHHTPLEGGAEGSLLCLLRHLPPGEVQAVLACPEGGPLDAQIPTGQVMRAPLTAWLPQRRLDPRALWTQWRHLCSMVRDLRRILGTYPADLIHANSWQAAVGALRAGCREPLLWHCRDLRVPRAVTALLGRRCAGVIAISRSVRGFLLSQGVAPDRLHLVYNGIDEAGVCTRVSREQVRAEWHIPAETPLVGSVGQLVPWKRHELILESAALVLKQVPGARFLLVGGEPPGCEGRRAQLERRAKDLGVDEAVTFTGYRRDATDLIYAMDVLAHAADTEPLGRVILEAMAAGTPVVAPGVAGPAELIEHETSGLLVAPGEAAALAEGVLRMLQDPGTAAGLAAGGRRRVREQFSAAAMARGTLEVYRHVLGMSGP